MDFGMESCELWISIPPSNMSHNPATRIHPPDGVVVDIWKLELVQELFPLAETSTRWSSVPQRSSLYAQGLVLKRDSNVQRLEEFACRSGQYTTFEISCGIPGDDNCILDFWQVKGSPLNGEWIELHTDPNGVESSPTLLGFAMRQFDSIHRA